MAAISALQGSLGVVLICGLVFAEEAGVPLPFAPGDLLLVMAGSLVAGGAVHWFVLIPCLLAASIGGAVLGYTWSRVLGASRLQAMARRVHAERHLARVQDRVGRAGAAAITGFRLLPGLRIYTTLAAGAFRVPAGTYLRGLVGSVVIWVTLFTALGAVAAEPVERVLGCLDHAASQLTIAAVAAALVAGAVALHRKGRAVRREVASV